MKNKIEKLLSYYLRFFQYAQANALSVVINQDFEDTTISIPKNIKIHIVTSEEIICLGFSDSVLTETLCYDFFELLKQNDNNPQKAFISWYNNEVLIVFKEYNIDLTRILQD